ncbi:MAG: recombination protein O N-terminal domain-containing protein, partial [Proteobacteria bacterium]|nr:recombination protein O N-terminal domain-containing protein [Pseudomonadota bacterium]
MEFEGLVIQVIPQKERDLIARVLLRQGTLTSFYVYGGMGGGKNSKPRLYEPGNLVKVHVRANQSGHTSQDSLKMVNEG